MLCLIKHKGYLIIVVPRVAFSLGLHIFELDAMKLSFF